ncbi:MAG: hypothetical protein AAB599_02660 [Patescibacteria group bacterium]
MAKNRTVIIDDSVKTEERKNPRTEEQTPGISHASRKSPQTEKVRGKKYIEAKSKVDLEKLYSPEEAVKLAKDTSYSKFGGSIQLHIVLKSGSVNKVLDLPHSSGKTKKVEVASDVTVEKLKGGKIDFDVLVAHPSMMPKLVPFAKVLGPKGLMPNPKMGTISAQPETAAKKWGGNTLQVKSEAKAPLVHTIIGKVDQPEKELVENLQAIVNTVGPKTIERAYLGASMGPSVKLAIIA